MRHAAGMRHEESVLTPTTSSLAAYSVTLSGELRLTETINAKVLLQFYGALKTTHNARQPTVKSLGDLRYPPIDFDVDA